MLVKPAPPRGFTLIELMTTIAVLVVLALVAVPSFNQFIANQRIRNASFDLMAALMLARNQAITQRGQVSLTPNGGGWSQGWVVADAANHRFGSQEAMPNLSITSGDGEASVIYGSDGRLASSATSFTIAPSVATSGVANRCIVIHLGGKPSSKQGACG